MLRVLLTALWFAVAVPALVPGLDYYLTPLQERPFVETHELFASSALLGHGYGVVGTLLILVGVVSYSLRKRVRALSRLGKLKPWLEVHIFLCTLGPFLVLLHTTGRIGGIVSIAFWSMTLVVASGVFGRYVYARIPKTLQGAFLSREALEQEHRGSVAALRNRFGLDEASVEHLLRKVRPASPRGPVHALLLALRWDLRRGGARRELALALAQTGASALDRSELAGLLHEEGRRELQMALLQPFQRLFRYWHVFHLPLAMVMALILAVHVTVVVLFGYAWIF